MTPSEDDPLLRRLSASDETASLALLVELCRQCPALRLWLWNDFIRDPKIRKRFGEVVDDAGQSPPPRFIDLSDDGRSWREERERLRAELPTRPFGGLSLGQVETLLRRFQAGGIDLGTFVLARDWRETGQASPAQIWAGVQFLDSLLPARDWRLHRNLADAFTFLRRFGKKAKRRASFSPADWWKAQILFYMLRQHHCLAKNLRQIAAVYLVDEEHMRSFCVVGGGVTELQKYAVLQLEQSALAGTNSLNEVFVAVGGMKLNALNPACVASANEGVSDNCVFYRNPAIVDRSRRCRGSRGPGVQYRRPLPPP